MSTRKALPHPAAHPGREQAPAPAAPVERAAPAVLHLQRALGNRAVGRLLRQARGEAAPATAPAPGHGIQRLISTENQPPTLHAPEGMAMDGEFRESLRVLLGGHQVTRTSWDHFRRYVAFSHGRWEIDANALAAWAGANLGRGLEPGQRAAAPPYQARVLPEEDPGHVDPQALANVEQQFADPAKVYQYSSADAIRWGEPDMGTRLLLSPHDMAEHGDPLPQNLVVGEGCVIQALNSFGVNVPNTQQNTTQAWHAYCRDHVPPIDYRTDSQYIKLYVEELGYTLVNNRPVPWNQIDWDELGDGDYLAGTYPFGPPQGNAVGHMIGVVVAGGEVQQVHDQQGITAPQLNGAGAANVHARYIFRM